MKRYFFTAIVSLMLFAVSFANGKGNLPQAKNKSRIEVYMQNLSKIKSSEINYAYISTAMFKQMFAMVGANVSLGVKSGGNVSLETIPNPLTSIKSMRRFATTGSEGYKLLHDALYGFLQENESVMGMELMALNREDGTLRVIYSDSASLLVINDDGDELAVVFIAGLSYENFIMMSDGGFDFNFDF